MTQKKEKVRNGETRSEGRPIVLCADDFGLSPGVNDAIIELIAQGAITATSVMSGQPFWSTGAAALRSVAAGRAAVGWHVTLTEQQPAFAHGRLARLGRLPPLKTLLARAWTRTLPLTAVRDELAAQLDAFEDQWGAAPAFVDGHQHVHLLPGVREVLLELLLERYPPTSFWARDTVEPIAAIRARGVGVGKAAFLSRLGRRWRALLDHHGIARNEGFAGAHDFAAAPPFRAKFQAFLRHAGPRPLLFLHPGIPDAALARVEQLVAARAWEYAYLKSDAVWADLAVAGLRPAVTW
ncbi:ChbG/HpnK family deacetylase [Hydrogenophilus thiooxidans]|uniref:ChbG/HpnK family deacetylase n=1 Tax=Hydrogenophilus thiooxidans TaxID=2820326 RepID=UPI001C212389|nr:ChbG/HpnK family deacetylase [Hydrogenophilus thiooxidans]